MNRSLCLFVSMGMLAAVFFMGCSGRENGGDAAGQGAREPLTVAMELQFPPFEMADKNGEPTGISVETARALGEYLGRPVRIENTSWVGLIPALQSGKADLVISSMTITEDRKRAVDFSIPYAASGLTLLIHGDSPVQGWRDLAAGRGTAAVKSGTIGALWAREHLEPGQVKLYEEVAACALEVSQGKADAFIYDALTTFKLQQKFPDSTRTNLASLPDTVGGWGVAVKKGRGDLLEEVNAFIRDYRERGGFARLEEKYLSGLATQFEREDIPSFFDPAALEQADQAP